MPRRGTVRLWLVSLGLWAAVAVVGMVTPLINPASRGEAMQWPNLVLQVFYWLSWACFTPFIVVLTRRRRLPRHWGVHLGAALGFLLTQAVAMSLVAKATMTSGIGLEPLSMIIRSWLSGRPVYFLLLYLLIVAAAEAVEYARTLREQSARTARLEGDLARAELASLRMQLQPHFLFNALHAVNVLIREDAAAAQRMVVGLGDLLRASLQGTPDQLVALAEERAMLERYLAVEAIRFQDRLRVRLDIALELEAAKVPPFLLQPLIENALKHGLAHSPAGGRLEVRARREGASLVLEVENDGPTPPPAAAEGLGLSLTRRRLEQLFQGKATLGLRPRLDGNGAVARVTLPWTA